MKILNTRLEDTIDILYEEQDLQGADSPYVLRITGKPEKVEVEMSDSTDRIIIITLKADFVSWEDPKDITITQIQTLISQLEKEKANKIRKLLV